MTGETPHPLHHDDHSHDLSRRSVIAGLAGLGAGALAASAGAAPAYAGDIPAPSPRPSHRPLPDESPDGPFILKAASIITMDSNRPRAEAVGIDAGRIVAVGSLASVSAKMPNADVLDVGDAVLMPGFVEPHSHPIDSGISSMSPAYNVSPWLVPTWQGIENLARQAVAEVPADRSIVMFGLDRLLHEVPFPDATTMDALFGDRVAVVIALSQHQAAVTTATLRQLGWIDTPPADPPGGTFGRRPDGSLDGTANEIPAIRRMITPALGQLGGSPLAQAAEYFAMMARAGITSMGDMGFTSQLLPVYTALCAMDTMPMRISVYQATNDTGYLEPLQSDLPVSRLMKGGIKFWADGSPWLGSIATTFPYLDTDAVRRAGITDLFPRDKALNYNRDQLDAMLAASAPSGWQVACHANGDMTIDLVLDAFEDALTANGLLGTDHRWRLEHVGAVRRDQLRRMSRLGVVPTFGLYQMMQWGDLLDGQLYASKYGARWSPVGDAAAVDLDHLHQSFHNDGNISPPNPLASVQAAVTRRSNILRRDGSYQLAAGHLHGPEQQVSLDIALRAITTNAAYILRREGEIGSIRRGHWADFVQLSADPHEADPRHLVDEVEIVGTWLSGSPVHPDAFVDQASGPSMRTDVAALRAKVGGCCAHSAHTVVGETEKMTS